MNDRDYEKEIASLNNDATRLLKKYEEKIKEIERLREENLLLRASEPMSKLQEDYGYKAEVNRLNNIINELEKWLKEEIDCYDSQEKGVIKFTYCDIMDKLQELKGEDKE